MTEMIKEEKVMRRLDADFNRDALPHLARRGAGVAVLVSAGVREPSCVVSDL
jgi:hypothetical protein